MSMEAGRAFLNTLRLHLRTVDKLAFWAESNDGPDDPREPFRRGPLLREGSDAMKKRGLPLP